VFEACVSSDMKEMCEHISMYMCMHAYSHAHVHKMRIYLKVLWLHK